MSEDRKFIPQVEELLTRAKNDKKIRDRNRKTLDKFVAKALLDSDKVELSYLLEGASRRVREMYEAEQLELRRKFGLRGTD